MLFNSYEFLVFLGIVLAGFHWIDSRDFPAVLGARPAHFWLLVASLYFYSWSVPSFFFVIAASLFVNYTIAGCLARANGVWVRVILITGIALNLAALGFFKYWDFFAENVAALTGSDAFVLNVLLPIGISFFTFQQIAYLIDAARGYVRHESPVSYGLFVTFFPQLIAGPIVHHKEMMPQFAGRQWRGLKLEHLVAGLAAFAIGLAKKTVIADQMALYASPLFNGVADGVVPTIFEAWTGSVAYSLQLYFDFSGYSDMAVGLGLMFGISLPLNFLSPYKATSIVDFWRRWHMTLSRFLRDYLYLPLGGNRHGKLMRYRNLALVMVIGGFWHGAGWTFIAWGALHGVYLAINHLWRDLARARGWSWTPPVWIARGFVFILVTIAWVLFRAEDMSSAGTILASMAGLNGVDLPQFLASAAGQHQDILAAFGISFDGLWAPINQIPWRTAFPLVLAGLALAWLAPSTSEIMRTVWTPSCGTKITSTSRLLWRPTATAAVAIAITFYAGVVATARTSEFLYFNF